MKKSFGTKNILTSNSVHIWFLDEDLAKSAEYLINPVLVTTIDGCYAMLVDAVLHVYGIRSKKFLDYYFHLDRRAETMDRFFPNWPFKKLPSLKYYTSRTSKWTRQCGEHFQYVVDYFRVLLTEHEYRFGRRHKLARFLDWLDCDMPAKLPMAHLKQIYLPWKSLKKKFRNRDIIEGYRRQYMDTYCYEDPIGAYMSSNRDVPEFVVRHYHLDTQAMIT